MHHNLEAIKTAENLERYCDQHLEKSGTKYKCPFCGVSTGNSFHVSGGRFKCFSCHEGGDLLDLIGHVEGIQGEEARIRRAAEVFGLEATPQEEAPDTTPQEVTPPHRHADRILFVVATPQEAARVRGLGYRADLCKDGNYLKFVPTFRDTGLTLVSMLNAEGERELSDACDHYGVACVRVSPTKARYAFSGDNAALSRALCNAAMEYDITLTESKERALLKVGVHPSWDMTQDILSGAWVRESVKVGVPSIDDSIGGVPRGGITMVGALSSTGKTSMCVQIADNMAREGTPVLFATVEQDRHELAVMSLCRIVGAKGYDYVSREPQKFRDQNGAYRPATRQWLQAGPDTWTDELRRAVTSAAYEYDRYASERLHYMQTEQPPTVADIRAAAEAVRDAHDGASPFVVIDYLQLLRHDGTRDERLAVNADMTALRTMARDLATPVIVISALNRASLTQGVTLASLRESSGIEYGADCVLGLQPHTLTERVRGAKGELKATEVNKCLDEFRDKAVKELDLRVLKNRGANVPLETPRLYFDGRCGLFYSGR